MIHGELSIGPPFSKTFFRIKINKIFKFYIVHNNYGKKIKEIADLVNDKISTAYLTLNDYVSTENMIPMFGGIHLSTVLPKYNVTSFQTGDILLSNIRPYFKKMWLANFNGGCSNDVLVIRVKKDFINNKYLFYALSNDSFFANYVSSCKGTKMPRGNKDTLLNWKIDIPNLKQQRHIVDTRGGHAS